MPESRPLRKKKHSNKDVYIRHTHTPLQLRMPERRPLSIARSYKAIHIIQTYTHTHTHTHTRERERERPDAREETLKHSNKDM